MHTTEIGKKYRDRISGVVGTATAHDEDKEGKTAPNGQVLPAGVFVTDYLTQLELDRVHLGDIEDPTVPKGHDLRWYPEGRLEPVAEADAPAARTRAPKPPKEA